MNPNAKLIWGLTNQASGLRLCYPKSHQVPILIKVIIFVTVIALAKKNQTC